MLRVAKATDNLIPKFEGQSPCWLAHSRGLGTIAERIGDSA